MPHFLGEITVFGNELVAIGGFHSSTVEVLQNGKWTNRIIPIVGQNANSLFQFSVLTGKELIVYGLYFKIYISFSSNLINRIIN